MIAELRTFIEVARRGTFTAAGDRVGLTQAAVSGQMKRLESRLGVRLFERTGRSAKLNVAGARTLARAAEIMALVDRLGDAALDDLQAQPLRVGAIASVQGSLLARALVPFRERFPSARLHVVPGVSLDLLDRIDAGALDLAVMIRPPFGLPADLRWRPLRREPYGLVVPSPVEGDDWMALLRSHRFLRYERTSFGGRQVDRFLRDLSLGVVDSIELDDVRAIVALVEAGLGVALMPISDAEPLEGRRVRVVPLGPRTFFREIGLCLARQDAGLGAADHLARCLAEAAGAGALGRHPTRQASPATSASTSA